MRPNDAISESFSDSMEVGKNREMKRKKSPRNLEIQCNEPSEHSHDTIVDIEMNQITNSLKSVKNLTQHSKNPKYQYQI